MPFKATAGLHHPVRCMRPLTYAADAPRGTMHGFLNVFVAAALCWSGSQAPLTEVLLEEDPRAFAFTADSVTWRQHALATAQVAAARADFAIAFGSCSFGEPTAELREMGVL